MQDKKHWYDGRFYNRFIAPNQDRLFFHIKKIIEPNLNVLDFGCGTGRLSFQLADYCNKIVGIDLSSKNISVAEAQLKSSCFSNVTFVHGTITKDFSGLKEKFDYAVMTYVIHEMPDNERIKLLIELKKFADKIIIGDYLTPTPKTLWGKINVLVEFLAGKDHYTNFKSYVKNGGLDFLISEAGLSKIKEIKNKPQTAHLIVVE